jgi:hypothetical protein
MIWMRVGVSIQRNAKKSDMPPRYDADWARVLPEAGKQSRRIARDRTIGHVEDLERLREHISDSEGWTLT